MLPEPPVPSQRALDRGLFSISAAASIATQVPKHKKSTENRNYDF